MVEVKRLCIWLLHKAKKVRIITQNKNLEDELIRALNLNNERKLLKHFDERSVDGYKRVLSNMSPDKLEIKLRDINMDTFWSSKVLIQIYDNSNINVLNIALKEMK